MENKKISLEFSKDNSIQLKNGISFVNNQKLINYLKSERFKEESDSLKYKETIETNVADLAKIKVNIELIGYFLINLVDNSENNHICMEILDRIKTLKSDSICDEGIQFEKIKKVIDILNDFNIAFVYFILEKGVSENCINFKDYKFNFPFLFINSTTNVKTAKIKKDKKIFPVIEAPFFNTDYLFNMLFALFVSFSLHMSISLFTNNSWKGILFVILFCALFCILNYCLFLIFYNDDADYMKGHKFIMGLYLSFGSGLGLIISILISQFYLNVLYNGWLIFIDIFAFILCIGAIFSSKIIALFKKR